MSSTHGHSVMLLRPLAVVLGRLSVDGERFLADLGVDAETKADAYVPTAKVDRALEGIAAERGDATFGLTMARAAVVRPLGLFGHLVWLSGTVRAALEQAARFYSLVTQRATLSLEVVERAGGERVATLTQRMLSGATRGPILTEFAFASFFLRARGGAGERFRLRGVRFAHGAKSGAPHEALFETGVTFRADVDELSLDAELLDLPLSGADPVTAAAIEQQATQLRAHAGPRTLGERVRDAVRGELPSSRPSLASVARKLGIGARSLRRQLEDEKLSLRAIVGDVRRDRATDLLAAGASIKDVAFQLGFSEPSAFSRAYKRWTGRSPGGDREG
jgi:AraC-like DNA-binding protein